MLFLFIDIILTLQSIVKLSHPSKIGGHQPSVSFLNEATTQNNLTRGSDHHEVKAGDKTLESLFNNICQVCFWAPDLQTSDAHLLAALFAFLVIVFILVVIIIHLFYL